jgi:hypothetical protein
MVDRFDFEVITGCSKCAGSTTELSSDLSRCAVVPSSTRSWKRFVEPGDVAESG